jgi:hypothetical protein
MNVNWQKKAWEEGTVFYHFVWQINKIALLLNYNYFAEFYNKK